MATVVIFQVITSFLILWDELGVAFPGDWSDLIIIPQLENVLLWSGGAWVFLLVVSRFLHQDFVVLRISLAILFSILCFGFIFGFYEKPSYVYFSALAGLHLLVIEIQLLWCYNRTSNFYSSLVGDK